MTRYLLKRVLSGLIGLFLLQTFLFFFAEATIPGDFTTQFALSWNRDRREEVQQELGLDRPLWERYGMWLGKLFRGSLGNSYYGYSVSEYLKHVIPPTALIFATGTAISFLLGQWLGKMVAWRGSGWLSSSATFGAITLYTTFPPWLGFLMTYFFARQLGWFRPILQANPFRENLGVWKDFPMTPQAVMWYMVLSLAIMALLLVGANVILKRLLRRRLPPLLHIILLAAGAYGSWSLFGFRLQAEEILSLAILPMLTYILLSFGETMLIMRTSMTDTLKEEYVRTAQAKGLPGHIVRDKHAARTAVLPVLSRLVISLPYLLTGLVILEDMLDWPGMSQALFGALYNQDTPVVLGALLLVGIISLVARLLLDILHAVLDPRIRYGTGSLERFS